jgi:uncharacterized protein YcbK (DUF882 family)
MMDYGFMDKLDHIRAAFGYPMRLSSAYRCLAHNRAVSSSGDSGPHPKGKAVDVKIYGPRALLLVRTALSFDISGVGVQQKGALNSRFIHLDQAHDERPSIWSY